MHSFCKHRCTLHYIIELHLYVQHSSIYVGTDTSVCILMLPVYARLLFICDIFHFVANMCWCYSLAYHHSGTYLCNWSCCLFRIAFSLCRNDISVCHSGYFSFKALHRLLLNVEHKIDIYVQMKKHHFYN